MTNTLEYNTDNPTTRDRQAVKDMLNVKHGKRAQNAPTGRMNVYVDGSFRAQLNDDAAHEYATREMAKGGEVIVSRKTHELSA